MSSMSIISYIKNNVFGSLTRNYVEIDYSIELILGVGS